MSVGECLAFGNKDFLTPEEALETWKNSPGHWRILTNEKYKYIIIKTGIVNDWMVVLAILTDKDV